MIFKIFSRSLRTTWSEKKMAALLWFVALLAAVPSFWTIHRSLNSYFGGRAVASEWLHGFNLNYFIEMINDFPTITTNFNAVIISSFILFLVVTLFLTGGIIGRLQLVASQGTPSNPGFNESFFQSGGKFFFRYLRVFSWTILLSFISLVFMMIGGYAGLLTAALIAFWMIVSDMTKIRLMAEGSGKVTKTYFSSVVWVLKNFLPVAGIYLLNFIALAAGFFIYKLVDNSIAPDSSLMIIIMFIWQQIYVFFRSFIRIQFLGSAVLVWIERPAISESPASETPITTDPNEQIQTAQ